jgi:hypothetical protein
MAPQAKKGVGQGGKSHMSDNWIKPVNDAKISYLFSTLTVTFKIDLFHMCLG